MRGAIVQAATVQRSAMCSALRNAWLSGRAIIRNVWVIMSVRLDKAWQAVDADTLGALPGHMGVFELADAGGAVLYIGFAGGRSRFGLRSEIAEAAARVPAASQFRLEVNTA